MPHVIPGGGGTTPLTPHEWLLATAQRPDILAALAARSFGAILGQYLAEERLDFWDRADIAAARAAGQFTNVLGEWFREEWNGFWVRSDIAPAWARGDFEAVFGQFIREQGGIIPAPTPAGPGASAAYAYGWCTYWAAVRCPWIPAGLGNADTWPIRAPAHGLQVTMIPTVGSVVCYGPGNGYSALGHVGVVVTVFSASSFEVSEMAYVAWNRTDLRTSTMQDVAGFILPPGVAPGAVVVIPPPAPAPGLGGARSAWASLASWIDAGLPAVRSALNAINGQLGGI